MMSFLQSILLSSLISICPTNSYDLANCYFQIAQKYQDPQICLQNNDIREECLNTYTIYMVYLDSMPVDESVCELQAEPENCYAFIKNPKLIEKSL